MKILALDLGKIKTVACDYSTDTHKSQYEKVKTTPFSLHQLFARRCPDRIVFEVGTSAGWVYDTAKEFGVEVQVANANHEGWRWRNVKNKTDRLDALKLARLSAVDQVPLVYMPSLAVRQRKSLIEYRSYLVGQRTRIRNRIRSIVDQVGRAMPSGARAWTLDSLSELAKMSVRLVEADIDQLWRGQLHEELTALDQVDVRLARVEARLESLNKSDPRVDQLRSIPGVGPRTAEALVTVIDDPHRFGSGKEVGSYVGLTPRLFESGSLSRTGRITRQGNRLLRKLLVEASWVSLRYNPYLRSIYERVRGGSKKRSKIAIVAVARHLLVAAWAMLRDGSRWCPSGISLGAKVT